MGPSCGKRCRFTTDENKFFITSTTIPNFCAKDFPEVYRCESVKKSGFKVGSTAEIKQCEQETRCISCKNAAGFPAGISKDSVAGFRLQVGEKNGHLKFTEAQVVNKLGETIVPLLNLYKQCRPLKA